MRRANIVLEAKIIHTVASALMLLIGVFLLIWPEPGRLAVRYLMGAGLLLMGLARVLGYFANDLYRLAFQYDLAMGIFCVIYGVLIIIHPAEAILSILVYSTGIYVLFDGLLKLQTALDAKVFGLKQWIGLLISSALVSVCGIIVLVGAVAWNVLTLVAVAAIVDGAENIWNTMGTVRVRAKKENRFEETFTDK